MSWARYARFAGIWNDLKKNFAVFFLSEKSGLKMEMQISGKKYVSAISPENTFRAHFRPIRQKSDSGFRVEQKCDNYLMRKTFGDISIQRFFDSTTLLTRFLGLWRKDISSETVQKTGHLTSSAFRTDYSRYLKEKDRLDDRSGWRWTSKCFHFHLCSLSSEAP